LVAESAGSAADPFVIALFGPTGIGKTGVSVELGDLITEAGGRAVAVNCDSMQIYDGLQVISGAPSRDQLNRLEHRLVSHVPIDSRYSSGRYSAEAHREIDSLLAGGTWPLLVGGTGLYLRSALSDLELLPEIPEAIRDRLAQDSADLGPRAMHERLPERFRGKIHPNDAKRVLRYLGLIEIGIDPHPDTAGGGRLWSQKLRHPTLLVGLSDEKEALGLRIRRRVESMARAGAPDEARRAVAAGVSETARKAIGFSEFLDEDIPAVEKSQLAFARRQMTWMKKMDGVCRIEREGRDDAAIASSIMGLVDRRAGLNASDTSPG
jgi:tRNA dimethylallyltransferase